MEFTDRLMAVDRAVASYIRFAGEPSPPPSETVPELWADLLHWHERFVILDPPMSKREVRRFVNEAVKVFYTEREAIGRGEEPLKRARREHSPEQAEARRVATRARRRRPFEIMDDRPNDVPYASPEPPFVSFAAMVNAGRDRPVEEPTYTYPLVGEEEDAYPAPEPGPSVGHVEF